MGAPEDYSSTIIIIGIVLSALELAAGIALGWWVRGTQKNKGAVEVEKARDVLNRLHDLTSSMAADVDEHSSRVQAISSELTATQTGDDPLNPQVLGAMTKIIEANERLQQQLASAEERLNQQAEQIEVHVAVSLTDALTGIANRRAFDREIGRRLAEWQRRQVPFSLAMIDVDHFKKFNDTYGHQAGDEVLRNVAGTLAKTMREMDVVARYGGEEFALILPSTILVEAGRGAERAHGAIAASSLEYGSQHLKVTASLGYAQALPEEDAASLVKRADEALYAAKKAGRNRSFWHDGSAKGPTGPFEAAKPDSKPVPVKEKDSSGNVTDALTGLTNRTSFCEEVRRRLAESQKFSTPLSLMLIKVDQMSKLGPAGDPASDRVLCAVTKVLSNLVHENDLVARYGVDCFSILLPGTELSGAAGIADRLRSLIAADPVIVKSDSSRVTTSVGLANVCAGDDSAALLKRAEAAVQAASAASGDCIYQHDGRACQRSTTAIPPLGGVMPSSLEMIASI